MMHNKEKNVQIGKIYLKSMIKVYFMKINVMLEIW